MEAPNHFQQKLESIAVSALVKYRSRSRQEHEYRSMVY